MDNQKLLTSEEEKRVKYKTINGQGFKKLIEAGFTWLKTNQQSVNSLNVFPVPDGDTGTNMVLTLQSAYNEINGSAEENIGEVAHRIAHGALMGARGNSGVILSQIFRGFARALDHFDVMDVNLFAQALDQARETAYKGVVRPVEGTILTVMKDIATIALQSSASSEDFLSLLEIIVKEADESVKRTPELLPILKQAGVVDSGGKGLFFIFEGFLKYMKDESLETPLFTVQPLSIMQLESLNDNDLIEEGQDYEVVVDFQPYESFVLEKFFEELNELGTSIQVGEGDGLYRTHIHVPLENRYKPIDLAMKFGTITKVAMENLNAQMETMNKSPAASSSFKLAQVQPGEIAVVVVSPGDGISQIFASLGAAAIVPGGQTMNPSTEEILAAFANLPTDNIIILPNNKNIILAAESTKAMTSKRVSVIPCTSVPQGLSAILRLVPNGDYQSVVNSMIAARQDVETGEITTATRSVQINGVDVKQGEIIVLYNGTLIKSCTSLEEACLSLLEHADTDNKERITLFYGKDLNESEISRIVSAIQEKYPNHELEVHNGGQPHYQFIIAIE